MATIKKIQLGAFAAGEIPFPLEHTYLTRSGSVIDISGWTVLGFYAEGPDSELLFDTVPVISDGPNGEVTYTWGPDDMQEPGDYSGLIWVENPGGTLRFASDRFVWTVEDGPGPTPPETP